jgi:hypothetical protein
VSPLGLCVLAGVFGLTLSVWGAIAFAISVVVFLVQRKLRKAPSLHIKRDIVSPSGVLALAIGGSFIYSPTCAYMDHTIRQAHEDMGAEFSAGNVQYEPVSFKVIYADYEFVGEGFQAQAKQVQVGAEWKGTDGLFSVDAIVDDLVLDIDLSHEGSSEPIPGDMPAFVVNNATLNLHDHETHAALVAARIASHSVNGGDEELWNAELTQINATVLDQNFEFQVDGDLVLKPSDDAVVVNEANFVIRREGEFHALVRGSFGDEQAGLQVTVDFINLHSFWSKYRVIDEHWGKARGTASISGNWNKANLTWDAELDDWGYYHKTAMEFDEDNAFIFQQANCLGSYAFGRDVEEELVLRLQAAGSLTTGKHFNAIGGGRLDLYLQRGTTRAEVNMDVIQGEINKPISWSGASKGLKDLTPNVVLLLEELPAMDVSWTANIEGLELKCEPLSGSLKGSLSGTLVRKEGLKSSIIRADGKLTLSDGIFSFLGSSGTVEGKINFKPDTSMHNADLNGNLSGMVGETPLNARIRGLLSRPGLFFSGIRMSPQALGRAIYDSGEFLEAVRSAKTTQLFGPTAAMQKNPFMAKTSGRVFFQFE